MSGSGSLLDSRLTLEQASQAVLQAVEAEDLAALAEALNAREASLAQTAQPSLEALELGERARLALEDLKRRWALETARLGQMHTAFVDPAAASPSLIVRG